MSERLGGALWVWGGGMAFVGGGGGEGGKRVIIYSARNYFLITPLD